MSVILCVKESVNFLYWRVAGIDLCSRSKPVVYTPVGKEIGIFNGLNDLVRDPCTDGRARGVYSTFHLCGKKRRRGEDKRGMRLMIKCSEQLVIIR